MNAFEEKMWERREGREEGEMIGEKRGKKIGERIGEERGKRIGEELEKKGWHKERKLNSGKLLARWWRRILILC